MGAFTTVSKPWGHELIWAKTDRYVGKILHICAGEALSLQYHRVKDETIMVLSGRLRFEFFADGEVPSVRELAPREPFHIAPGLRHRMIALEDTDVLEVSTPELEDVVRLEDRYGRTDPLSPFFPDAAYGVTVSLRVDENLPRLELPRVELIGAPVIDLLARTVVMSTAAARRLIAQGAAYLNDVVVSDAERRITREDLTAEGTCVLGTKKDPWCIRAV